MVLTTANGCLQTGCKIGWCVLLEPMELTTANGCLPTGCLKGEKTRTKGEQKKNSR
jgi:hypothetical protein